MGKRREAVNLSFSFYRLVVSHTQRITKKIPIKILPQIGLKTIHQLQSIYPVSLRTINAIPRRPKNPIEELLLLFCISTFYKI